MAAYRITLGLLLTIHITFVSCDEKFDFPEIRNGNEMENLMVGNWVYQNVYIESDTVVVLGIDTISTGYFQNFWRDGEPIIDTERDTDMRRSYLKYGTDNSYELFSEVDNQALGKDENYQPNYGYWDIEISGDSTILVHNKLLDYQKRYQIITLTKDSLVRKLIGPRVVYYYGELFAGYTRFTAHTWIETFIRKGQ